MDTQSILNYPIILISRVLFWSFGCGYYQIKFMWFLSYCYIGVMVAAMSFGFVISVIGLMIVMEWIDRKLSEIKHGYAGVNNQYVSRINKIK